jgi:hypothetical protein
MLDRNSPVSTLQQTLRDWGKKATIVAKPVVLAEPGC